MDVSHHLLQSTSSIPEIHVPLQVEPVLGRRAKQLAEPERHLRTQGPTLAQQLIHRLPRDPCGLRELRHRKCELRKELFTQNLTRVNRAARQGAGVGNARRDTLRLVVITRLEFINAWHSINERRCAAAKKVFQCPYGALVTGRGMSEL